MPSDIARQWFIPGEGIDRHVISADIQRYLGNDATVRPGQGTGNEQGVSGYWIKAYRNLTNAMIADLRADSLRWRQEQRTTGARGENYDQSNTYNRGAAGAQERSQRRGADSPAYDASHSSGRDRAPEVRRPQGRDSSSAMDIDTPSIPQPDRRHGQSGRGHQQDPRAHPQDPRGHPQDTRGHPQDPRAHPQDPRAFAPPPDSRNYQPDVMMSDTYGRAPVTASYAGDPRYAPSYPPQPNDPGMSGFGRQQPPPGNYYPVPVTSAYDAVPAMPTRQEPPQYGGGSYGQPQPPRQDHYRDQRDPRAPDPRDPRYAGRGYDPSDAYPSPAATISSTVRDREPVTSPPQQSMYGQPQFDQYGRPIAPSAVPSGYSQPSSRDNYARERPPPSGGDPRDARRRRH